MKPNTHLLSRLPTRLLVVTGLALTFLPSTYSPPVRAQRISVQTGPAPSVVEAGTFVSLQGRFSLALPQQQHAFRGLSIATPIGQATGDSYEWRMKEGAFTAGYVDAAQPLDDPETSKLVFAACVSPWKRQPARHSLNKAPAIEDQRDGITSAAREAVDSIEPGVKRSGTPGTVKEIIQSPRSGRQRNHHE